MTRAELRNQALVAAEIARQEGFDHTLEALLAIVHALDQREFDIKSRLALSDA